MKKKWVWLLLAVLLCAALPLAGCANQYFGGIKERDNGENEDFTGAVLPESRDNAYGGKVDATLYYRYLDEKLLAPVDQVFTVTAEKTIEELVIQALIDGPGEGNYQYGQLLHPLTRLVSVKAQSGNLSITFNDAFLYLLENEGYDSGMQRKALAVQSIVNALTGIGNYSRVLILIDYAGNGIGERLSMRDVSEGGVADRAMEPMGYDANIVITPHKTMEMVLQAIVEKDYDKLERYIADVDYNGAEGPSRQQVAERMNTKASLVSFTLHEEFTVSRDGQRATGLVDITYVDNSGHPSELTALPVRLLREEVWKMSFPSMDAMLPAY